MDFTAETNTSFIKQKIDDLEKMTDQDNPYTRIVFSDKFYEARSWLKKQYQKLGLLVSTDDAGNLIGLLKSKIDTHKVVIIGSHIDTVPSGGRYDGIAGLVAALCVVKHINENHINLPFNLAVYDYLGEELNDWSISCIGTRLILGGINKYI